MKNIPSHRGLFAAAAGLHATLATAFSIEPADILIYSYEPITIRPHIGITETYNDNIFSQPDGIDDFITTLSPGLNVQLGRSAGNFLLVDYTFHKHWYADRSDLNAGEHSIGLSSRIRGEKFSLAGTDRIQWLSSPVGLVDVVNTASGPGSGGPIDVGSDPGDGSEPGGDPSSPTGPLPLPGQDPGPIRGEDILGREERTRLGERSVERFVISDSYTVSYRFSEKTSAYLNGAYSENDYEEGLSLYDMNTWRGTGGFAFHAFPKTSFFGEVYYGQTSTTPNFDGPENPNVEFIGGSLGVRGRFTEKISGTAKAGYEHRDFSDNSDAPSSPVADVSVDYRISQKTSASLIYSRLHDVSVQFSRESYTANILSLRLNQGLGTSGKWFASLGGSYGLYEYESEGLASKREYDRYSANFNLAYRIQLWLTANLGYSFESIRTDSAGLQEYDINRVSVSLNVGY